MKRSLGVCILLFTLLSSLFGQKKDSKPLIYEYTGFLPNVTVGYHNAVTTNVGLYYGDFDLYDINDSLSTGVFGSWGAYINAGVLLKKEMIYSGTLGVELNAIGKTMAFACGIEILYLQNKDNDYSLSISPKIGIPMGFLNFYYAYQFGMNNWARKELGRHKFTVSINLDFEGIKLLRENRLH